MAKRKRKKPPAKKAAPTLTTTLMTAAARAARAMLMLVSRSTGAAVRDSAAGWRALRHHGARRMLWAVLPLLAGMLLLTIAAWRAKAVLAVTGAPTTPPFAVAADMPSSALLTADDGYVLALTLTVKSCSAPVKVFAELVLPEDYFSAETRESDVTIRRALVGLAVDDPSVELESVVQSGWQSDRSLLRAPKWLIPFHKHLLVGGTGRAAVVRVDNWQSRPHQIDTWFSAKWLSPRGYGSCWLRLPALTGGYVPNVAINASDEIDSKVGPKSGATKPTRSSGGSTRIERHEPDGSTVVFGENEPDHVDYVGGTTPPAIGYITLDSPMSIVAGESTAPAPALGTPKWTCTTKAHQRTLDLLGQGGSAEGDFQYADPPHLSDFPTSPPFDCSGVVPLTEPGSSPAHDLYLLVLGGLISLGGGLLLEPPLRWMRGRSSAQDNSPETA